MIAGSIALLAILVAAACALTVRDVFADSRRDRTGVALVASWLGITAVAVAGMAMWAFLDPSVTSTGPATVVVIR